MSITQNACCIYDLKPNGQFFKSEKIAVEHEGVFDEISLPKKGI